MEGRAPRWRALPRLGSASRRTEGDAGHRRRAACSAAPGRGAGHPPGSLPPGFLDVRLRLRRSRRVPTAGRRLVTARPRVARCGGGRAQPGQRARADRVPRRQRHGLLLPARCPFHGGAGDDHAHAAGGVPRDQPDLDPRVRGARRARRRIHVMAVALALGTLAAISPVDAEYQGTRQVIRQFELARREPPAGDPVLARVARRLAEDALRGTSAGAADLVNISRAMSAEGSWDPPPRALIVQGSPPELMLQSFLAREGFGDRPATHLGVGGAWHGERAAMAVLLTERKVDLQPFPRRLARAGEARLLCGTLRPGRSDPAVLITQPSGEVRQLALARREGPSFCADVPLPSTGEYAVEGVAEGQRGPEVAALFFVQAGEVGTREQLPWFREPSTPADARAALLARINALRAASGLAPVGLDV